MIEVKYSADTASITGYASVWDGAPDAKRDLVSRGAFADSIARRLPEMRREHKNVVGQWTSATEDEIGLKVSGTVSDPATVRDLRSGAIDGLSIGFIDQKSVRRPDGVRVLQQVELPEISLVKRPAKSAARILQLKSEDTMSDLETKDAGAGDTTGGTEVKAIDLTALETKAKAALDEALKPITDRLGKVEIVLKRPGAAAETKSGDPEKKAFERFLRFGADALDITERKSLRLANDEQAGYLAVPEFVAQIDKNITLFSPVRSVASVRNTSASEVQTLRRTTAATAFWVGEEEDRTETEIKYGKNSYPVAELATFVDVSNQLLEDAAVDVAAEIALEFAEAFGSTEASAFVVGDGVKKPLGFMADPVLGYTPSGSASAVTADSIIDLYHSVKPAYRVNGVFMANSNTLSTLRKLKTGDGQYLLSTAGLAGAPATTLLGRPVLEAPDMDDIGAGKFPIAFGDFKLGFSIFDRIALSIVRDPFTQATKGRTRFHGRRRVAAGVRRAEAIRRLKVAVS